MLEYDILPQMAFNWMIVTYFFLGGLSAGAFLFSVTVNYWIKEFKPLAKIGAVITPLSLGLGMFFLFIDLGQPFRVWRLFLTFAPRSSIFWGTWILNGFLLLSLAYAWFLIMGEENKAKKFGYIGLPFAVVTGSYTGLLLAQAPGKVLWHTALGPWLFFVGGLISGIAVVIAVSVAMQENNVLIAKLSKFLAVLILLELGMVITELIVLFNGGPDAVITVKALLGGSYSFLFWIVEILIGAVVPVIAFLRTQTSTRMHAVASVMVLIGIYTMRYIIVIGGQTIR